MNTTERMYRIDWIRDDNNTRGILFPGPLTHREAEVCASKTTRYPWRRLFFVEVTP